jgi:predicted enzyme related to lactoylglutathione lyase
MSNPVMHFEVMAAKNVDGVRKFYADAFGWKINADNPMNYGLVDTGAGIGIGGGIGQPMPGGPSYATFYIAVDDLARALEKIESLGGKTVMPPMDVPDGSVSIAMFNDPAGNLIGLVKPHGQVR